MKKIKELRICKGYTQAELAKEVGIGQNSLSQYENGLRTPRPKIALRLATTLGCSVEELFSQDA